MTCVVTLFLNEHSQLKKWLKLKKSSVKTLVNDCCAKYSLNLINVKFQIMYESNYKYL